MSAREALASSLMFLSKEQKDEEASYIMRRLAAKGYRILAPDKLDPATIERGREAVAALEQISAVCADNLARPRETCRHDLALEFVAEVASRALQDQEQPS